MTQQVINTGTVPNDGTGDTLLSAMEKVNANFTDLYGTSYSTNVVNQFNGRSGNVNLLMTDITSALTYTPLNKAGDTATGLMVFNNGLVSNAGVSATSNIALLAAQPGVPTGNMLRLSALDTQSTSIVLDSYKNAGNPTSTVLVRGARGTGSATTSVSSGDLIGQFSAVGYGSNQYASTPGGQINFVAEGSGLFTNASTPTAIAFQVTANGSNAPSEQMRLNSSGNLILSGTGAIQLPVGTTGQQPSPSAAGMVRYNSTTSRYEFYNGSTWINHVRLNGDTMTGTLTAPALVGTTGAATIDSFVIGSITPEAATVTNLTATGTLTGFVGRLLNIQVFTNSGTYTPTTGTNKIIVEVQAPGGGSGGTTTTATTTTSISAAGSAGSYAKVFYTSGVTSQTITIGTTGAAGAAASTGGTGGTTSFGSLISCPGGIGGVAGAAVAPPYGGAAAASPSAPTISGGTTIISSVGARSGQSCSLGLVANNVTILQPGADSNLSGGALASSAIGYGTGGPSAGIGISTTGAVGFAGGAGVIIVYEYA